MEYGTTLGLAQDFQANERINDLYRQEEALNRSKAMAEQKAKLYADSIKYQNAMNPFDHEIIKKANQQRVMDLGVWAKNNPNYKYDPTLMAEYQNRLDDIKSNPDVLRGMASDSAFNELNKDLQEVSKNPEYHDQEAYNQLLAQKDNYIKFGNQKGYEAAQKEGFQPFVYQKPREFKNLAESGQARGNKFKSNPMTMSIQYLNNGRDGAFQIVPKEEYLRAEAEQEYLDNKRQYDVQYKNKGIDPIEAAKKHILTGIETKIDIGEKNHLGEQMALARYTQGLKEASASHGISPYKKAIQEPGYVKVTGDVLAKTFGTNTEHFYIDGDGKTVKASGDVFHYDGNLYDEGYNPKGNYKKNGVKIADGYILKPLVWGKENGAVIDPWGLGDKEIAPEWKNSAQLIDSPPDKDGNSVKLIKLKAKATLDSNNPYYQGKFDKEILTTDQRNQAGTPGGTGMQLMEDDAGNVFDVSSGTPKFIRKNK